MTANYQTLVELFDDARTRFAEQPFIGRKTDGTWQWVSYREFAERVLALRGGLAQLGLGRGDRLALITDNSVEWAASAFAAYGLGVAIVPMYEAQLDKEWIFILKDCGAKAVVCATAVIRDKLLAAKAELPALAHHIVIRGEGLTFAWLLRAAPATASVNEPELPATFIYTSGTTGNPKGVILTHRNFASNVNACQDALPIQTSDRTLSFLPWAHAFGQMAELYTLMSRGASMALVESIDKIIPNLAEVKPTILVSVPRIFNRIYEGVNKKMAQEGGIKKKLFDAALKNAKHRRALAKAGQASMLADTLHLAFDKIVFSKVRERFGGRLRYAVSGGAAMVPEVGEFIDSLGIVILEGYGLTETAPVVAVNRADKRRLGSVGPVLANVRVVIDNPGEDGNGEIIVYGPNVMQGYYKLDEENAKVFTPDHGFRTGDLGHIDSDGFLFITGRLKEQYKLENGKYVAPAPLEELLKLSPYIANILVYGDNRPVNVALIVINPETAAEWAKAHGKDAKSLVIDAEFRTAVAADLDKHSQGFKSFERIKNFALIDEDFTTQNGMLTPKLSLKRRVVVTRYKDVLDKLYQR
jgi:long-chain acyl-CoA synthetase